MRGSVSPRLGSCRLSIASLLHALLHRSRYQHEPVDRDVLVRPVANVHAYSRAAEYKRLATRSGLAGNGMQIIRYVLIASDGCCVASQHMWIGVCRFMRRPRKIYKRQS